MFVSKEKLKKAIAKSTMNRPFEEIEKILLDKPFTGFGSYENPSVYVGNIKFMLSQQLAERPICAVLKKDYLKEFCSNDVVITRNCVRKMI